MRVWSTSFSVFRTKCFWTHIWHKYICLFTYLFLVTISSRGGTKWDTQWLDGSLLGLEGWNLGPFSSSAVLRNQGLSGQVSKLSPTPALWEDLCPLRLPNLLGATNPQADHLSIMWHYKEAFGMTGLCYFPSTPYLTLLWTPHPILMPREAGLTPLISHQDRTARMKCVTIPFTTPMQIPPKQCRILKTKGPTPETVSPDFQSFGST